MQYRREVDGLRAFAVGAVVLYHADFPGLSGGYVGVDVFFVISGFLITSILMTDAAKGRVSLTQFYERRARRILPALAGMLLPTTIAAYIFMDSDHLAMYSDSLMSVALFASNVFFYITSDYFAPAAETLPLLHTWSLAVEEHFYIFFPLVMVAFPRMRRRMFVVVLVATSIGSFLIGAWLLERDAIAANFFLPFSRAWELLAGSLLACLPRAIYGRAISEIGSGCGLFAIGASVITFDDRTAFPSYVTLLPILGTVLFPAFADSRTLTGRLASLSVFIGIGKISYSLYLWHQPIFAFLRVAWSTTPPRIAFAVATIVSIALAYVSWRYVEQPFRDATKKSRRSVLMWSTTVLVGTVGVGFLGHIQHGFPGRFSTQSYSASMTSSPLRDKCHTEGRDHLHPAAACRYFGKDVTWATFGDSHLVELSYTLAKRLEPRGEGVLHLTFSGCAPALYFESAKPGCSAWIRESLATLSADRRIRDVMVGFRYSAFLFGEHVAKYPELPNEEPSRNFAGDTRGLKRSQALAMYWKGLDGIVSTLIAAGKRVHILYPIPELPLDVRKGLLPATAFHDHLRFDPVRTSPWAYYLKRNEFILDKLQQLPYSPRLLAIKPSDVICGNGYCSAGRGNLALYFDDDHLSLAGAELVTNAIDLAP